MTKSNTFENELLLLIYNNTDIADIGDAAGLQNSAAAGSLYVALHTADPGEGGTASTSECAYTAPYARQAVARSGAGWTVSGNQVSNAALIQFPQCSGGSPETAQYVSITTALSGASKILWSGQLGSNLAISTGIQPQFAIGALVISED
jgi:hypothetical protein